jgi:hypothetical protein
MPEYFNSGLVWGKTFVPALAVWLATITALGTWLAAIVILWRYSDRVADRLAGSKGSAAQGERLDFPFDMGVGLAGLIFLIEGLKNVAGIAVALCFIERDEFVAAYRPRGLVDVGHLAVYSAEAILGLVLFVGARPIVKGIMKLRGMPPRADDEDAV